MTQTPPPLSECYHKHLIANREFVRRQYAAMRAAAKCRTGRVLALAREYVRVWDESRDADWNTALYQPRRLLSDALRDEGCDEEDVHDLILNGWGKSTADALLGLWDEWEKEQL